MCRLVAWIGAERYIEDVVFTPEQSLVTQCKTALACKTPVKRLSMQMASAWPGTTLVSSLVYTCDGQRYGIGRADVGENAVTPHMRFSAC